MIAISGPARSEMGTVDVASTSNGYNARLMWRAMEEL